MKSSHVIIAVVAALVLAGGIYAYQNFFQGAEIRETKACAAAGCDFEGVIVLRKGDAFPPKCPKCGQNTVLAKVTCRNCEHRQFRNTDLKAYLPGKEDLPDATKCDKCGQTIVRS